MNLFLNPATTPPAIQLKSNGSPISMMRLKRGAEVPLTVTLLGVQEATNLRLGIKATHEGDVLALAAAETGTPGEEGMTFSLSLVLRSAALDAALRVGEETSLAKLSAMAEFVWQEGTQTRISDTVSVTLLNDIVRLATTSPGGGTEVYPSAESLATKAWVRELRATAAVAGLVLLESDAIIEGEHTAVALTAAGAIAIPKATRTVAGTTLLGTDQVLSGLNILPVGRDGEGRLAVDASGLSAYDLAVKAGYVGTAEDWLASLKGEPGEPGEPGSPGDGLTAEDVEALLTGALENELLVDFSTPEGTEDAYFMYAEIAEANVPAGELAEVVLRGPEDNTGAYNQPVHLCIWENKGGNSWEPLAASVNAVTPEGNTDMVWRFDDGVRLSGRTIRICAIDTNENGPVWQENRKLRARVSVSDDGSAIRQPSAVSRLLEMSFRMKEAVSTYTPREDYLSHLRDMAAHLSPAEHALLTATLSESETYGRVLSAQTLQVGRSDGRLLVLSNSGITLAALGNCRTFGLQAPEDIHFTAPTQYAAEVNASTGVGTLIWWTTGSATALSPYGISQAGSGFGRSDRPTDIKGSTLSFNGHPIDPAALADLLANKDALLALTAPASATEPAPESADDETTTAPEA